MSVQNLTEFKANSNAKIMVMNQITSFNNVILLYSGANFTGTIKSIESTKLVADAETVFNGKIETESLKGKFNNNNNNNNNAKINITGIAKKATIQTHNLSLCNAKNFIANSLYVIAE